MKKPKKFNRKKNLEVDVFDVLMSNSSSISGILLFSIEKALQIEGTKVIEFG